MTYVSGINHGRETECEPVSAVTDSVKYGSVVGSYVSKNPTVELEQLRTVVYNIYPFGFNSSDVCHGFDSREDNKVFFYNLVIMYWTLNSIYMQFE